MRVNHQFGPFYHSNSKILILGSFPSVKSRQQQFYYAHPQNRFWKVLAACYSDEIPVTLEDKKSFLTRHGIALWDVIDSCEIKGSSDASIKEPIATQINAVIQNSKIEKIILNGKTALKYYQKFYSKSDIAYISAPSTSPANAAYSLELLVQEWKKVLF